MGSTKGVRFYWALHTAIDVGINFFDTAELYGDGYSEEILGKALFHQREKVVIGSKVNPEHLSREKLIKACEDSLRRLKTDYIDIYHIHFPNYEVPISETLEALEKLRNEGKIRAIGVSNPHLARKLEKSSSEGICSLISPA